MRIILNKIRNTLYISRRRIPIKPKQIAITTIMLPHAYNIRNIAIAHIMTPNAYNTKQIVTNCNCTHHEPARV